MFIFKNPIKENRKKQDAIIRALAIAENLLGKKYTRISAVLPLKSATIRSTLIPGNTTS